MYETEITVVWPEGLAMRYLKDSIQKTENDPKLSTKLTTSVLKQSEFDIYSKGVVVGIFDHSKSLIIR